MLHDRPRSLQQRALEDDPNRPMSAMAYGYGEDVDSDTGMTGSGPDTMGQDIDMEDVGPSTAPPAVETTE